MICLKIFMSNIFILFLFQVRLSNILKVTSIRFEGVRGGGYQGDIAIDDVSLEDGSCPLRGDCNFEKGRCTWLEVRDGSDTFDWQLGSGSTQSFSTGPSNDHTLNNLQGEFLYKDFLIEE